MAIDRPRQNVVVVLPSPGSDDVRITTFTGVSTLENKIDARKYRKASEKAESGFSTI